jgi:hypothetical protein
LRHPTWLRRFVSLRVTQRFENTTRKAIDISYIIPNNMKICLYDTTLRIRDEVVKPRLERTGVAKEIYDAAKAEGRTAILGLPLGEGLIEFRLGILPPGSKREVDVDCGLVASSSGIDKVGFKFPLDTCTPSGSTRCVTADLAAGFLFRLRNAAGAEVSSISSNAPGRFDPKSCTYEIAAPVPAPALFLTTTLRSAIRSRALSAGR